MNIVSRLRTPVLVFALAAAAGCVETPADSAVWDRGGKADITGDAWLPDSREYKVLLDPALFSGTTPEADFAAVEEVYAEIATALELVDLQLDTTAPELDKERVIRFLDVPGSCDLRELGFVIRERITPSSGKRQLTLKHRGNTYYDIASVDLEPVDGSKEKFEEDVVLPYSIKYSRSATVKLGNEVVDDVGNLRDLFGSLGDISGAHIALGTVGDVTVDERVYELGDVYLADVEAEISLSLWRLDGAPTPDVVELSFSYDAVGAEFPFEAVVRGHDLFDAFTLLTGILDAGTKTGRVYEAGAAFCGR